MKGITKIQLIAYIVILAGCSTMQPPRYASSVDNVYELRKYENEKAFVSRFSQSARFDSNCRLMGPIEPADGLRMAEFIGKAFNDEFKMAEIYSENGTEISGDITLVDFSSTHGLTNGYWDIAVSLTSSNGKSLDVFNRHTFASGFDAITACNATADALSSAVQDLIYKTIIDAKFAELL